MLYFIIAFGLLGVVFQAIVTKWSVQRNNPKMKYMSYVFYMIPMIVGGLMLTINFNDNSLFIGFLIMVFTSSALIGSAIMSIVYAMTANKRKY